jgi:adenylate cyclase
MPERARKALSARTRQVLRYLGVIAVAAACALGLARTQWHQSLENIYYDYWHVFSGVRYLPQHTAVVSMDDETLAALKDDPLAFWAPHFGRVMDVLSRAGAKAVGLDFIYQVSAENWLRKLNLPDSEISRNYDSPLRAALAQGDKILITHLVELNSGELQLLLPPQDHLVLLPGGINDLGIANLHPDDDKYVRQFYPVMIPDPKYPGVGFGTQLALRAAGLDPSLQHWDIAGNRIERRLEAHPIGYSGPTGTVPTLSMNVLLQPDSVSDPRVQALKGKVVIIAANNAGSSDRHFTPYSRGARADQMAGGEIHANIVETLLTGRYPRHLQLAGEIAYLLLALMLATYLFQRLAADRGAIAGLLMAANLPVPAFVAFRYDLVLPVAEPQVGLAIAFLATLALRLTGEERERAKLKQMFGRYVSDDVVDTLLAEGDRPDLAGEERHVTVLFSDIRNFTTISERLSAHEVVEMLNAYFSRVGEPILDQGGMVNKYIGDAVMAVFGAPKFYPDHARRALAAGLEMVKEAADFRHWMHQRFPDRGLPEFAIGVGVHTGTCVVGDIGSVKRTEFTAIGDTVNAASRLEGATKELGVPLVASSVTVHAAGEGVRTGLRQTVKVKGRDEPIEVYEIVSVGAPAGGLPAG